LKKLIKRNPGLRGYLIFGAEKIVCGNSSSNAFFDSRFNKEKIIVVVVVVVYTEYSVRSSSSRRMIIKI